MGMKISKAEYARRRKNLMSLMEPNSIAIVPSAKEQQRSRDTEYPFRQDSDFHYLSGFDEPEAVLVLIPGRKHGQFVMFCRDSDPAMELWHGYRAGLEGVCDAHGADDAFPIGDIDDILPGLLEGRERVYYSMGRSVDFDQQIMSWVNRIRSKVSTGAVPPGEFTDLDHMLHDLRLVKSAAEIRLLRRAGEITSRAHIRAMQQCKPSVYEYQLEAEIQHEFACSGARFPAYSSIVGSGANACTLHYLANKDRMSDGDLVLIDAGCEYEYYAADVTRTFPVNGRFSRQQRAIYDRGLVALGLLKGRVSSLIKREAYKDFYMHRAGHWLGLDVHDVGDYRVADEWRELEPGMVMTVEPGIYISPNNKKVSKAWRGIGVRIEDDVVVTPEGCTVISSGVPKTVDEIEALMAAARQ